jgi:cell division protein FtsB
VRLRAPVSGIRWDRIARISLLIVFMLVALIGARGALTFLHARSEAAQQLAIVRTLEHQNRQLSAQDRALRQPATITRDARVLGMVRSGEQAFVVTGFPRH